MNFTLNTLLKPVKNNKIAVINVANAEILLTPEKKYDMMYIGNNSFVLKIISNKNSTLCIYMHKSRMIILEKHTMDMFEYYGLFREDYDSDRLTAAESRIIEHLFDKYLPKEGKVIDTSAGLGTFAFRFADLGYSVTAGDLLAEHVEAINSSPNATKLEKTYCASPRNLSQFEDESYDILVSLGSIYHMKTKAERESFVRESLRILKPGGYFAFTYMTPMAMTLGQYFKAMRTFDVLEKLKAYRKLANVEKSHTCDMFYGMTFEEITDIAREYKIDILTIASTYSMLYNMVEEVEELSEEDYHKFLEGQIATCEDPFVARYCMRGLVIGKKKSVDMFD